MGSNYHSRTSQFCRFANGLTASTVAGIAGFFLVPQVLAISEYHSGLTKAGSFSSSPVAAHAPAATAMLPAATATVASYFGKHSEF